MPEYQPFRDMLNRCYREATASFATHGGRGIRVSKEWLPEKQGGTKTSREAFESFYGSLGDRPKGMTLERIDVNGNYAPENCRWDTWKRQANNRRNTLLVTIHGETHLLSKWATITGVCGSLLRHRLIAGWPAEQAIRPVGKSGTRDMDVLGLRLWKGKREIDEHPATSRIASDRV